MTRHQICEVCRVGRVFSGHPTPHRHRFFTTVRATERFDLVVKFNAVRSHSRNPQNRIMTFGGGMQKRRNEQQKSGESELPIINAKQCSARPIKRCYFLYMPGRTRWNLHAKLGLKCFTVGSFSAFFLVFGSYSISWNAAKQSATHKSTTNANATEVAEIEKYCTEVQARTSKREPDFVFGLPSSTDK